MKYLLRTLLVAAMPYLIRALLKRMDAPTRSAPGSKRRGLLIEGEKLS
jgi:hypothetical protein